MKYTVIFWTTIVLIFAFYCFQTKQAERRIVSVYNTNSYMGMGDFMRGILHLYQNEDSKKVFINYNNHPISKYLSNQNGNTISLKDIENKPIYKSDESNYSIFEKQNKTICLCHNGVPTYPIDKTILEKVRNSFVPNDELTMGIHLAMDTINIKPKKFIVVHVRLNDSNQRRSSLYMSDKLKNLLNSLKRLELENMPIVIMSNSMITKTSIASHYNFKTIDIVPVHTGGVSIDTQNGSNVNDIKDTLIEFFIMSKAFKIYQHNENKNHQSGFSQRISELYEVPIERI